MPVNKSEPIYSLLIKGNAEIAPGWLRTFAKDHGILAGLKTNSFVIRSLWSGATLKRLLSVALFIGFVVLVEHYFGWVRLLAPWQTLPAGQVFAAGGMAFVSYWARTMRLYDYIRPPGTAAVPAHPAPTALVHPYTAEVSEMQEKFPAARIGGHLWAVLQSDTAT